MATPTSRTSKGRKILAVLFVKKGAKLPTKYATLKADLYAWVFGGIVGLCLALLIANRIFIDFKGDLNFLNIWIFQTIAFCVGAGTLWLFNNIWLVFSKSTAKFFGEKKRMPNLPVTINWFLVVVAMWAALIIGSWRVHAYGIEKPIEIPPDCAAIHWDAVPKGYYAEECPGWGN